MRYKGEYQPAELLCPTTMKYVPYAGAIGHLQKYRFSPLEDGFAAKRAALSPPDVNNTPLPPAKDTTTAQAGAASDVVPPAPPVVIPKLNQFAPKFTPAVPCRYSSIELEIGPESVVTVGDLTDKGKKIVTPKLLEFLSTCGPLVDPTRIRFMFH